MLPLDYESHPLLSGLLPKPGIVQHALCGPCPPGKDWKRDTELTFESIAETEADGPPTGVVG